MTSLLVTNAISEYFPAGLDKCILPTDLVKLCFEYIVEVKKEWYENGQLSSEEPYVNNEKHGLCKDWYENGELMFEHPYVNGKIHGLLKRWYKNGELNFEHPYVNGKIHGLCKDWFENGKLEFEY